MRDKKKGVMTEARAGRTHNRGGGVGTFRRYLAPVQSGLWEAPRQTLRNKTIALYHVVVPATKDRPPDSRSVVFKTWTSSLLFILK